MKNTQLKTTVSDTLPVVAGYIVLGIGFGMLMTAKGYPAVFAVLMSIFIYAGSMQYAAIPLFAENAGLLTVAFTALCVNARHFFYGISMEEKYKNAGKIKPYLIFGLTDETYSLVCSGEKDMRYCFIVTLLDHIYWVTGTVLGVTVGSFIHFNTEGIDFALTALFVTVLVSQIKNDKKYFSSSVGFIASVVCLLIFGRDNFLIPSMLLIAAALLIYTKRGVKDE